MSVRWKLNILLEETLHEKKMFWVTIDESELEGSPKLEGSTKTNNPAFLAVVIDENMYDVLCTANIMA